MGLVVFYIYFFTHFLIVLFLKGFSFKIYEIVLKSGSATKRSFESLLSLAKRFKKGWGLLILDPDILSHLASLPFQLRRPPRQRRCSLDPEALPSEALGCLSWPESRISRF